MVKVYVYVLSAPMGICSCGFFCGAPRMRAPRKKNGMDYALCGDVQESAGDRYTSRGPEVAVR